MASELEIKKYLFDSCKSVFSSLGFKGGARKVALSLENAILQLVYIDGGCVTDSEKHLLKFNYSYAIYFRSLNVFFRSDDDIKKYQTIKSDLGGALIEKIDDKLIDRDMWAKYSSVEDIENIILPALNSSCISIIKKANEDDYYFSGRQWWRDGNRSAINFVLRMICLASLRGDEVFFDEILHDIKNSGSSQTFRAVNEVLRKMDKSELH